MNKVKSSPVVKVVAPVVKKVVKVVAPVVQRKATTALKPADKPVLSTQLLNSIMGNLGAAIKAGKKRRRWLQSRLVDLPAPGHRRDDVVV